MLPASGRLGDRPKIGADGGVWPERPHSLPQLRVVDGELPRPPMNVWRRQQCEWGVEREWLTQLVWSTV